MYKKVSTKLNFVEVEKNILEFWKENKIFEKSLTHRTNCPTFSFYDGPPTANGKPHIGHVLTRSIKDLIPRYKTMKGYNVLRKAGWDTHGLPVELEVEKELGISGKPQIEEYGIEKFINKCKESVFKYSKEWEEMSERVAFWADMKNPYVTYYNEYIESVWWSLKTIWEKGLLYKGHKVVPYCPRCGTSLSSHEVAQGYEEITEPSIYVKFKQKDSNDTYFLVWTTTPWTLPSNVALAVNANEIYVKVKTERGEKFILAKERLSVLDEGYEIIEEVLGKKLLGIEYQPLFNYVKPEKKAFYVVEGDFVTLSEGTGIVHIAPAFGEDDYNVGKKYNLPLVQLVNPEGKFTDEVIEWKGMFVKTADPHIIEHLNSTNKLYKTEDYLHSYPFCWRCDTPLLYYARDTWFIKTTAIKEKLLANNQKINWLPEHIKNGRFGNFLENVIDWSLSRERYWGTPLNLWVCECGYVHAVGSISELKEMGINVPENIELHKPYIDEVHLKCPKCNGLMERVKDVIDCWYDSGAMPFAQWHYPFENKELFEKNFPADFISEAIDQTRGWFYTLLVISTLLFDEPAYKNVITLGLILDKDGQKMSKHKGNVVDPWEIFNKQGADALRWYFYVSSVPWLPIRFSDEGVTEVQRKFMGTLWNVYAFYVLYADVDKFDPTKHAKSNNNIMDKWILSRLNSVIKKVTEYLDNYRITEAAREINSFVDELSNWYVRRNRERFWVVGTSTTKTDAYLTLYEVLEKTSRLIAPFVPFMAEEIYQNIVRTVDKTAPESVHLCDYPNVEETLIDPELEKQMSDIMNIVALGRAARNAANIKIRQPLGSMFIKCDKSVVLTQELIDIIKDELNVKSIITVDSLNEFEQYICKPNLGVIGPKFGKLLPEIAEALKTVDNKFVKSLLTYGTAQLNLKNASINLSKEDVLIEAVAKEGYVIQTDNKFTVILDITLSEELINEGYIREITSKIQNMRKDAGFEVTDKIILYYYGNDKLDKVIKDNQEYLMNQTLCKKIVDQKLDSIEYKEMNINNEKLFMAVKLA